MSDLIDDEQMSMLVEGAGVEGVRPILDAYWESNESLLSQLKAAIDAADTAALAAAAHGLKGSSANLGATVVAERARAIEVAAKDGDMDAAKAAFSHLDDDIAKVRDAFEAILAAAS
ncbi:MAG: Hpt domain-containing protein [Pseudomonadota bacterium]